MKKTNIKKTIIIVGCIIIIIPIIFWILFFRSHYVNPFSKITKNMTSDKIIEAYGVPDNNDKFLEWTDLTYDNCNFGGLKGTFNCSVKNGALVCTNWTFILPENKRIKNYSLQIRIIQDMLKKMTNVEGTISDSEDYREITYKNTRENSRIHVQLYDYITNPGLFCSSGGRVINITYYL